MVKNLDNVNKFLMYPRFVQVFLNNQLEGILNHNRIFVTPSHTKKIFENMKRVGKGFSGRDTPLFPTMMVKAQEDMGEGSTNPTDSYHTPTIIQPSTSQPQKTKQHRKPRRKDTELPQTSVSISVAGEAVNEEMDDSLKRIATTATSLDVEQDNGANTPQSGEDSLKLTELMEICTKLQQRVLDLETTKSTQALEIDSLKRRDASKQERIADIDANEDITLVSTHDKQMFDADQDLSGEEVFVTQQYKNVVEKEVDAAQIQVTTAATTPIILIDEDDVQAKINVDYQLAKRLQAQEQQELNDEEKAKLFMQLLEKRRKFVAVKRAEEKRNKPPTQAQQRKIMCTYLKNMEGKKLTNLKNKSFDSIQKMFDRAFKRKIDDDKDTAELQQLMRIIPDEEGVAIDDMPLAVKASSIVD
nr:hypothetical protein [Tanacetum cinerariifolium]